MKQIIVASLMVPLAWFAEASVIRYDRTVNGPVSEATSWVGGVIPGPEDLVWIDKVTAAGTVDYVTFTFTNDTSWGGIYLQTADKEIKLTMTAGNGPVLSLGKDGIKSVTSNIKGIDINVPVRLVADTEMDFYGPVSLMRPIDLAGHTLRIGGGATKQIKERVTGPGVLEVGASFQVLNDAIFSNVDVRVVGDGGTAQFLGANALARMSSFSNSSSTARLDFYNNTYGVPSTNMLSSGLANESGAFWLLLEQTRPTKYIARMPSFTRESGAVFFLGTALAQSRPDDTAAVAGANIILDTPPTLIGGTEGVSCPVIPGAFSSTNLVPTGLATYDAERGVRVLDPATEYATAITDGQTELNNVMFDNFQAGPMGILLTQPLTTINSVLINETGYDYTANGTNSSGVAIRGAAGTTLRIASGTIFANQELTAPATNDVMLFDVPNLDFNGQDGVVFIKKTAGTSNGSCPAPLSWQSIPTNVSDKGIGFYGYSGASTAYVFIEGARDYTYTGAVTVGSTVYCRLNRSVPDSIKGTLVIDGGTCQYNNQLDDDEADLIVRSGSSSVKGGASNSGNSGVEIFRDLTMFGGSHTIGGGGGGSTSMRSARIYGGSFTLGRGAVGTVSNGFVLAGGTLAIGSTTDSNRWGGYLDVSGGMLVSNTFSNMSYTPVNIGYSIIYRPCSLRLYDTLTVVGNDVNTNPVVFARNEYDQAAAAKFTSALALNGEIRIEVTDGAAETDLDCQLDVVDGKSAVGTLVKLGDGTLLLSAPTNDLTGGVRVNAGTLVSGAAFSNCDFSVATGATLASCGTLFVNGAVTFESGATLALRSPNAILDVTGAISGEGTVSVSVDVPANGEDRLLARAAGGIAPVFSVDNAKWTIIKKGGETELWLHRRADGLKIIICGDTGLTVPYDWIVNAVSSVDVDDEASVSNALVSLGKNNMERWKSYALGLDPMREDSVVLCDAMQNGDPKSITFAALNVKPATNANLAVSYVLQGASDNIWHDIVTNSCNSLVLALPSPYTRFRICADLILH